VQLALHVPSQRPEHWPFTSTAQRPVHVALHCPRNSPPSHCGTCPGVTCASHCPTHCAYASTLTWHTGGVAETWICVWFPARIAASSSRICCATRVHTARVAGTSGEAGCNSAGGICRSFAMRVHASFSVRSRSAAVATNVAADDKNVSSFWAATDAP
jgi:hypothetical protein